MPKRTSSPPSDLQLLGATAVARIVGKDRHFVTRAWDAGDLEAITIRGRRYVTRRALERFLAGSASRKPRGA